MKRAAPPDEHYGTENVVVIPDCSEEEYSKKEKEFLVALKKTPEEIQRIEEQTRGQANNPLCTRYGRRNERRALHEFQEAHNLIVEPCGLFIDEEHYMLGATPDGLVGTDACVEIKCPANAADMHPKDAILQKKLNMLNCAMKIYRDDDFWNTKIVTQLREFYFKCLLPEIIDPRSTRGREIRNPPR
ncbi:exonuclease phage-type/recb c-terminal domain-containing protein [Holotrichia oblita]|uniref:Exonuclease phage-type/recb c-terminal domain-containing protein n=1 Tax=Holotrichia oblita TaxID=644536 RepID=A0ACB9TZG5_HOLOL|nr:exonuclease phage-type/recb c-terminal domain-containing protein [Holotrichia oblita]